MALVAALVLGAQDRDDLSVGLLLTFAALVLLPLAVGAALTERCTAWRVNGVQRCEQPRRGPLHRCGAHRGQHVTLYDLAGVLAYGIALVNVVVLVAAATPAGTAVTTP